MSIGLAETGIAEAPISLFNPIGLVEEPVLDRLQVSVAEIVKGIGEELTDIAIQIVNSPTAKDFSALRKQLFPSYIQLATALGHMVLAKIDKADLPGLIEASFTELESKTMPKARDYFGDETYNEILFSVATLKSAYRWVPRLLSANPSDERLWPEDIKLARDFTTTATWAQFHLHCIKIALDKNQTIIPEVLQQLLEGVRLSLMAYSYVRAALNLRNIPEIGSDEGWSTSWDAEDEALANAD
jgi:hypothetical protein